MIVKVDINTGNMSGINIGNERYLSYQIYKNDIYLFPYANTNHMIKINTLNDNVESINLDIPNEYANEDFVEYFTHKVDDGNNEKLLRKHSRSKEATVLVSPSLTTGADLKDDMSRFQIIVKLPWPSLVDKRVKKKIEDDSDWYATEIFKTLIQATGRSTRSENDWSITYVLDSSFYHWVYKFKHWFNKYFLKRIIWKKDDYGKQ
jgi:hypothetical protein